VAFRAIRAHKLRSFLTLLGIIIGVTTIVGVVGIITGLKYLRAGKVIILAPDMYIVTPLWHHPQPRGIHPGHQAAPAHLGGVPAHQQWRAQPCAMTATRSFKMLPSATAPTAWRIPSWWAARQLCQRP